MTSLRAPVRAVPAPTTRARFQLGAVVLPLATALALLALAVLLVLPPPVLHQLLDAADSAAWLGVSRAEAHRFSDATVAELVLGPGTFQIAGPTGTPLYDASEVGHLRDARVLFYGFLLLAVVSATAVILGLARSRGAARRETWGRIAKGGAGLAIGVAVLGVVALVAFEPAFELFHRIFFPGGNWAFDPATQRLVQLYPFLFWQLASGLIGLIAAVLGVGAWWIASRKA